MEHKVRFVLIIIFRGVYPGILSQSLNPNEEFSYLHGPSGSREQSGSSRVSRSELSA